ncbi:DnaB-like helicase C-terminal domain-containing protein [Bacillus chungangensis]|uniref:Replicative DNA helicase n=1 Tax=Bacillus chungangensis TaxID=587633 RepID=A0ABT9WMC6_9BACI|nr:DnaB-like helicase C-terminal domain-containing protein [Bacillus chungangensis]MDQ0174444.1 replicative DNA helicase [Bacillus chungangensis]
MPEVSDSYDYLARKIKSYSAKQAVEELFVTKTFEQKYRELSGESFLDWLQTETESIKMRTSVRNKVGTNFTNVTEKFLSEYDRRKIGESFRVWKSFLPEINETIGGYISSNVYVVYGKPGRGKSVITLMEAIEAATQGANVLIWAMEMGWFEVWVRIFVFISAKQGVTTAHLHGFDLTAGFDSSEIRYGKLDKDFEEAFRNFIATVNDQIEGNITVRAVDDTDFDNRSLRALEADIEATKADVVVLDPFYYLDYEKNTSKTAGGDAAATSMKLRHLAGRTQTVIFAITQADETKEEKAEDGNREIVLPERKDVKKTTQLIQDAYLLIGVDTDYKQGRGLVGINKGRDGGEGLAVEILYIPQVGVVKQLETGEAAVSQFDF